MATPTPNDPHSGKGKNKRLAEDELPLPMATSDAAKEAGLNILSRHHNRSTNIATDSSSARPRFNVYKACLRHKDLFFQLVLRMPYKELVALYAIDKEFHFRLNHYSTYLIHEYVRRHAPLAGHIFSWVLFPDVCISDPMLRPMDGREWLARDVPSFRWVGLVLYRQKIVRSILTMLSMEGHRVPAACEAALMKYWCIMGMAQSRLRVAFVADKEIWTDKDLINFQLFLVKLDMRLSDPIRGNGTCALGPMLLSQKGLSTLWKVLSGKLKLNYENTSDMILRTYAAEELDFNANPMLGEEISTNVPLHEEGLLALEGWNLHGARMPLALNIILAESIRRKLHVEQYYLDFVLYGTADLKNGKNIPIPIRLRRDKQVKLPSEGMATKEMKEKIIGLFDKGFGTRVPGRPLAKH
ncbi:hypothetical protein PtrSN002B_010934 [Pyrenophora tritici-repentis]|nr:hypothetical protein A1F99_122880 [Pyrenophora tritici-repentis]KAG9376300.1 hypothetical protein A1F94_012847 [Pyrenophora tritici-repentis]KAI0569933.1 hypothetical protein Alg130_11430 [Pyrenophora tritici-repentis]KAI0579015.1 hypothetical protein Alg215_06031 [Pyrenophora tritici-repentis]KAI0604406.1 hypothetical protein TUN205_11347 [Pyrenophora tritici-repentis]